MSDFNSLMSKNPQPKSEQAKSLRATKPVTPKGFSARRSKRLFKFMPKWLAYIMIAFTILLLLAAYVYRDDLFAAYLDPGQPFQTYDAPAAPHYADADAWLAIPDVGDSREGTRGRGDIFVVTPTLYSGGRDWVAPLNSSAVQTGLTRIITPNYVTPYRSAGRVFAPKYRHASLYSFMTNRDDARLAQHFAYEDVARAFETFLKSNPPERPITLIGHGQGGLHVSQNIAYNKF